MLLVSLISVIAIILVYQALFYWVFKDPVSIKGFVKLARENNAAREIGFKINNRISKAFAIEKIILKIGEQYHSLDDFKIIKYPFKVEGFETFILKLPVEILQQLTGKDGDEWRRMLTKVSITIRGNNGSYRSDQISLK